MLTQGIENISVPGKVKRWSIMTSTKKYCTIYNIFSMSQQSIYCSGPINPADTNCGKADIVYCHAGDDNRVLHRRVVEIPDKTNPSTCDNFQGCISQAAHSGVSDYIQWDSTAGACTYSESINSSSLPGCDKSTCPLPGTSLNCCDLSLGTIKPTGFSAGSKCSTDCSLVTYVNPNKPDDVANCTPCSGHGKPVDGKCVCDTDHKGTYCDQDISCQDIININPSDPRVDKCRVWCSGAKGNHGRYGLNDWMYHPPIDQNCLATHAANDAPDTVCEKVSKPWHYDYPMNGTQTVCTPACGSKACTS